MRFRSSSCFPCSPGCSSRSSCYFVRRMPEFYEFPRPRQGKTWPSRRDPGIRSIPISSRRSCARSEPSPEVLAEAFHGHDAIRALAQACVPSRDACRACTTVSAIRHARCRARPLGAADRRVRTRLQHSSAHRIILGPGAGGNAWIRVAVWAIPRSHCLLVHAAWATHVKRGAGPGVLPSLASRFARPPAKPAGLRGAPSGRVLDKSSWPFARQCSRFGSPATRRAAG